MAGYDCAVIGGGPGGYVCAIRLAQLGKKVVVVEKEKVGGVCLNYGCIPTKTYITATEPLIKKRLLNRLGIKMENPQIDIDKLRSFKNQVVTKLVRGVEYLFRKHGVDLISDTGSLNEPNKITTSTKEIIADKIIIATGTKPYELPSVKFDHQRIVSSKDLLDLPNVPERLLVVGAGAVGLELGMIYHNLGSQVTIIEMMDNILPECDQEMTGILKKSIERSGLKIITSTKIQDYKEIETFDNVLIAVGRKPTVPECSFDLKLDENGYITVNSQLQTNVSDIFAIGDITGPPLLAHRASHQGIMAAEILAGKEKSQLELGPVPACVFTHPEYAWVGDNENDVENAIVGRFPLAASGRATSMGERDGLCKIIIDHQSHKIKGAHIISPMASELIGSVTLAIKYGISAEQFEEVIHPHPTVSEILPETLANCFHRSIHAI